jgi:hypothetical protein
VAVDGRCDLLVSLLVVAAGENPAKYFVDGDPLDKQTAANFSVAAGLQPNLCGTHGPK